MMMKHVGKRLKKLEEKLLKKRTRSERRIRGKDYWRMKLNGRPMRPKGWRLIV